MACAWALFSNHTHNLIVNKVPAMFLVHDNRSFLDSIWARFRDSIRSGNRECAGHCEDDKLLRWKRGEDLGCVNIHHAMPFGLRARGWTQ